MFTIVLYDFGMIWLELTRTGDVFSRTTMVLFLSRNKSSRNEWNFARIFYTIKDIFWSQEPPKGGTWVGTTHQGTPLLQACPGGLSPPGGLADPETYAIKSHFSRKKSGITNYHDPRDGAAVTSCSSSGGQIWSPFEAPKRGIFGLRHHQPSFITNFMMLPTASE